MQTSHRHRGGRSDPQLEPHEREDDEHDREDDGSQREPPNFAPQALDLSATGPNGQPRLIGAGGMPH